MHKSFWEVGYQQLATHHMLSFSGSILVDVKIWQIANWVSRFSLVALLIAIGPILTEVMVT